MKKILQICGCRPHLIKLIDFSDTFNQRVIWTGQHYSPELSTKLMDEFGTKIDAGYKCTELWRMISVIGEDIRSWKPDCVVVYGDTRSTIAGAISAFDHNVKLAHIEAGLRLKKEQGTRYEDKARRSIDSLADYLFAPTKEAAETLQKEEVAGKVWFVGDIHYERYLKQRAHNKTIVLTIHRQEHVDDKALLTKLFDWLEKDGSPTFFPAHPRTMSKIIDYKIKVPKNVTATIPISYGELQEMVSLAKLVVTDSGGLMREATFAGTPVKVIGESEWEDELHRFGDGDTSKKIKQILAKELKGVSVHASS